MAAAVVSLVLLAALLLSSTTAEVRTPDMAATPSGTMGAGCAL
jgi:hypothetical protein